MWSILKLATWGSNVAQWHLEVLFRSTSIFVVRTEKKLHLEKNCLSVNRADMWTTNLTVPSNRKAVQLVEGGAYVLLATHWRTISPLCLFTLNSFANPLYNICFWLHRAAKDLPSLDIVSKFHISEKVLKQSFTWMKNGPKWSLTHVKKHTHTQSGRSVLRKVGFFAFQH